MRYLIVGGTGTLGHAVIAYLFKTDKNAEIHVFSREELKQKQLRKIHPEVTCHLGDVSNKGQVDTVFNFVSPDVVFHLAALKHVDIAEENPEYCYAVNIMGTIHVAEAAVRCFADHVVFSSTDKAVLPINAYGAAKFAAEKYLYQMNNRGLKTKFSVFRWGNVLYSRGSVMHEFAETLLSERKVYITDFKMTRFFIHIDDVARFMCDNYKSAPKDQPLVPQMRAAKVVDLADAVARYLEIDDYQIVESGIRRGEKFHEVLWSEHDHCLRSDNCVQFSPDELLALVKRALT